nr:adenylate/guanylate cyclase domain-containing protein [uncultured Carboxylicivirga sp.]
MFSLDKFKIKMYLVYRAFFYHLFFWIASFSLFVFISGIDSIYINYFDILLKDDIYGNTFLLSLFLTVLFASLDAMFSDVILRNSPIRFLISLRFVLYFLLGYAIVFFSENKQLQWGDLIDYHGLIKIMPPLSLTHIRFLIWFYISCLLNSLLRSVLHKVGIDNFMRWALGMMNKPRAEKRIFMFIDMKSSVTIAENLKHKHFSHLVQDVFADLAIVENYHGEIYQYLGDGAIVSWSLKKGLRNNNCIKSFYAFQKVIKRKWRIYDFRYGMVPEFKAGIHIGEIMVLQVGRRKRDISYNGDTLNTTARIESMCNVCKESLLISGVLYESLKERDGFNFKEIDGQKVKLKGKRQAVQIYGVKQKSKTKKKKGKKA